MRVIIGDSGELKLVLLICFFNVNKISIKLSAVLMVDYFKQDILLMEAK